MPDGLITLNTPAGCAPIEGAFDHQCQRINLSTGEVEGWQPDAPAADGMRDWSWNGRRWVEVPTAAAIARDVRAERSRRLTACDWVIARALETGDAVPQAWLTYRQALRDITAQPDFPHINWPEEPA